MRDLKTTPVGVVTYPSTKTKNILTEEAKESRHYTKAEDKYLHFREKLSLGMGTIANLSELDLENVLEQIDTKIDWVKSEHDEYGRDDWRTDCKLTFSYFLARRV